MRRREFIKPLAGVVATCAAWMVAVTAALCQDSGKPAKLNGEIEHCRSTKDEQARMHCHGEGNSGAPVSPSQQEPSGPGTWRLARTPNPAGGPDAISIATTADATRSDHVVAGLMLRCGEGASTEVLIALSEPLQPPTHPKVTVQAGATTTEFIGSVVKPGALVLLPEKASALVEGAWQSAPELAVAIAEEHRSLHGVIPLEDISSAMQTLQSNCATGTVHRRRHRE